MADNVAITAGSGTNIATDDVSSVHFQKVKLDLGGDGLSSPAAVGGGTEATALRVTVATDSTGVLSVDDNGSTLSIDDGGGSITVDGTVAVSGTVTVGSHAVTNAGTFATQVDGAALTALQLIDNIVVVEDAAHSSGDSGVMSLAVRSDSDASLASATGDYTPLQVDANGYLKVNIKAGAGSGGTSATDDAAFTVASGSGTPIMGYAAADAVDSGDVGVVRMTTARGLHTVAVNSTGTVIDPQTDDASFTPASGLISVIGGIVTADSVDSGDAGAIAMTTARAMHVAVQGTVAVTDNSGSLTVDNAGTFATQATLQTGSALVGDVGISGARTSGGSTPYKNLDVDETEDEVKATAGQVYWIHAVNLAATKRYLKFYNATAANVTVGTTTPVLTFTLPTQGDTNGAGFTLAIPNGIAFGTAITVAATTGFADNDTGAPGANEIILNLGYA